MENNETFIPKWEYKTGYGSNEIEELGKQGWEAVGIFPKSGSIFLKRPCGKIRVQEKQKEPQYINRD